MNTVIARWVALGAVVGPVLFTLAWLILGLLSPAYYYGPFFTIAPHAGITVPIDWLELGSRGLFMNAAFVFCGLLLLAGVFGIFHTIGDMSLFHRWSCTALLSLSPLGLVACGLVPLDSAFLYQSPDEIARSLLMPSLSPAHHALHNTYYVVAPRSWVFPFWNPLHSLSFLLTAASPVLSFLIAGFFLRRIQSWRHFGTWLLLGSPLTLLMCAFFLGTFKPLPTAVAEPGLSLLKLGGLTDRALVLEVQAWFVALGYMAFRRSETSSPKAS